MFIKQHLDTLIYHRELYCQSVIGMNGAHASMIFTYLHTVHPDHPMSMTEAQSKYIVGKSSHAYSLVNQSMVGLCHLCLRLVRPLLEVIIFT